MRNETFGLIFTVLAGLILLTGCEKTYEPAAYRAAPRVDAGGDDAAGGKLPDITAWTSADAIRNAGLGGKARGYSGLRGYRGNALRGYSGMGRPYRGYAGQSLNYRGYSSRPGQYRGNVQLRNYRGRK